MEDELKKKFCELYHKYYFLILKRSYYFFKNQELARDITQDVFYKVVVELQKNNMKVLEIGYLMRLATNLFIDHIKRKGPKTLVPIEEESKDGIFEFDGVSFADETIQIRELFEKLPSSLCEIAVFRFVDGYNLEEIANITNISKRTLQRKLNKIKKRLGAILTSGHPPPQF